MSSQRFLHSTTSVAGSSSSSSRSRPGSGQWRILRKWAMSRSSSEASLSSTILKDSDNEYLGNESQALQQRSLTRSPRSPLSGNTKSRLPHENTKRKLAISGAGSPPGMSPRKVSRPELEKVASSRAPSHSTSVATPVVATPRRSFWSISHREEAPSDSLARNAQNGRKSAPEEKSADGFSRVRQGQANTSSQLSTRSQQGLASGSSRHQNATSGRERTLASTSSGRMTLKEKSAVKFSTKRQGHKSSTLRSPSKCKQVAPKKAVRKPGYKILGEIDRHRSSTVTLIPRLPFARVVREILFRITGDDFKMQKLALKALHEASEAVIVALLEGSNVLAHHAHRVTIMSRDLDKLLTLIKSYGNMHGCLS
ncbi:uncharacterized protein [Dermacentor andersoni]|uniref:uncharacterized protein n=1 Tax=Dermacentor andersoni TaxID=34620 RepID=UPI002155BFA5|nr:uncharacterized protein LOC126544150 isoform X1 [Dermacentor andersoni]